MTWFCLVNFELLLESKLKWSFGIQKLEIHMLMNFFTIETNTTHFRLTS